LTEVAVVVDCHALLGEGPVWIPEDEALYWVDILGRTVYRYRPTDRSVSQFEVDRTVGCVSSRRTGGLVLGLQDEVVAFDPESGALTTIAPIEQDDPTTRINDGTCDPAGRFWVGTQPWDETRVGVAALYCVDTDGSCRRMLDNVTISNGLGWSADARTMYYIDTQNQTVDAFDFDLDSGDISARRRLLEIDESEGYPDGLAMDAEDCIWVALWGGAAVHRYSPDGDKLQVVEIPATQVTSCAFGGPELEDLYITSATMELPQADLLAHPRSGALFRCRVGVAGMATSTYNG
jgi:sugar lactone lactonase YvrE